MPKLSAFSFAVRYVDSKEQHIQGIHPYEFGVVETLADTLFDYVMLAPLGDFWWQPLIDSAASFCFPVFC